MTMQGDGGRFVLYRKEIDGVQRVVEKMRIHLRLQGFDLILPFNELELVDLVDQTVGLGQRAVKEIFAR